MAASLRHGSLTASAVHLCIDMQNLFAEDTPWRTPWMERVRPVVAKLARYCAHATVFTLFTPPNSSDEVAAPWQRYFEGWGELTRRHIDPHLLELVSELRKL